MVNRFITRTPIEIGNDVWFFDVSGDPSTEGQTAGVGSLARVVDGATPGAIYRKTDTGDTDWTLISSPFNGGNLAASMAALGVAAGDTYPATTDGAQVLLAAETFARVVMIAVEAGAAFADGDGAQPEFQIGLDDGEGFSPDFAAETVFADASQGDRFAFAGEIPAGSALVVLAAAGTGTATGILLVSAHALPSGS